MSLGSISLGVLGLVLLGIGYVFAFRARTALAFQERYAEAVSWRPPSDDPEYYEETREQRRWVFRLGGVVLFTVGSLLLAVVVYGTFVVGSFP